MEENIKSLSDKWYCADIVIIKVTLSLIQRLMEEGDGCPINMEAKEWNSLLHTICNKLSFAKDNWNKHDYYRVLAIREAEEGLTLVANNIAKLWD